MVRAWFMENKVTDQRLDNHLNPPKYISIEEVNKLTEVEYFSIDSKNYQNDPVLKELRQTRNYSYEDEITVCKEKTPDFQKKLISFFTEHLHTDEEIRLVLDGTGYFDVRDPDENWIRIAVEAGDLLVLPAGIYHRFTTDTTDYIKAKRYFVGEPVWQPYNRPADEMECRKEYLQIIVGH